MPKGSFSVSANGPRDVGRAIGKAFSDRVGPAWLSAAQNIVPFRSGALYRALDWGVDDSNPDDIILTVGVNPATPEAVDYGPYVERGTSRMAPQPFVVPALNQIGASIR